MPRNAKQDAVDEPTFERLLEATDELDEPYQTECAGILIFGGRLGMRGPRHSSEVHPAVGRRDRRSAAGHTPIAPGEYRLHFSKWRIAPCPQATACVQTVHGSRSLS